MFKKLCPVSLGLSGAAVGILFVVVVGVLGSFGFFKEMIEMVQKMHPSFVLTVGGVAVAAVVVGVKSFIYFFLLAWFYDFFVGRLPHSMCCGCSDKSCKPGDMK